MVLFSPSDNTVCTGLLKLLEQNDLVSSAGETAQMEGKKIMHIKAGDWFAP